MDTLQGRYGTPALRHRQATGMTIYLTALAVVGVALGLGARMRFNTLTWQTALELGVVVIFALGNIRQVHRRFRYLNSLEDRGVSRDIISTCWSWVVQDMALLFFTAALVFIVLQQLLRVAG